MKKVLIVVVAVPIFFWCIWIVIPASTAQSMIENSLKDRNIQIEVTGFRKGILYNISIDEITFSNTGGELLTFRAIDAQINPLHLFLLKLRGSFEGVLYDGYAKGLIALKKNSGEIALDFQKANIQEVPLFRLAGIKATGTIAGKFVMKNDTGHIEFTTNDASFEPAVFSGVVVPLNFFHSGKGSLNIYGNTVSIPSVALEGEEIYARLKGTIKNSVMDLDIEVMPGKSFVENPLFVHEFEKYKVSPGYYVIPVKGNLSL